MVRIVAPALPLHSRESIQKGDLMTWTQSKLSGDSKFIGFLALTTIFLSQMAVAGSTFFGSGAPGSVSQLPSSELRKSIESLPAATQARAVQWLQSVEFSSEDLAFMKADRNGSIYYTDTFDAGKSRKHASTVAAVPPTVNAKTVLKLHSNPGAANTIFLDFDGAEISGTAWNSQTSASSLNAAPYDTDGKPKSFSNSEVGDIVDIWERVAEDFAPFNVDVTTEDPGTHGKNTIWVVVTDSDVRGNKPLPAAKADSVTYMNIFGFSHTTYYSPAFIYNNNLGSPDGIAEAASHTIGHTMGLSHDSGSGSGKGMVSWAPIMGLNHQNQVTQWSKGEYRGAVNKQDDIGILIGALGLRRDDHDDSRFDKGTPLVVDNRGRVTSINPGISPNDHKPENKGLIEDQDDIDVFSFTAGKGVVDLTVVPAWQAYAQDPQRGANLDVHIALFDASGKKIAESDPRDETSSHLRKTVSPGRYKLEISGAGNTASAYSRYGSIGQYYISGSVPPGGKSTLAKTGR